jgi:ABC-type nitrate/sulfonate/bicarbonate transport system substrate-binding protein
MQRSPNCRRRQLSLAAALLALDFIAPTASRAATTRTARIAQGPRTTERSLAWLAEESGIFARLGLRAEFAAADPDSGAALASVLEGKSHLAYSGIAQVAQRILDGGDPVIVATPLEPGRGGFLMASPRIRGPEQLAGARVGVLSAAGPSALAAGAVLERSNVTANFVAFRSFEAVYAALADGAIDAGWLPVDLSFKGRAAFGWTGFEGVRITLAGGYVTTRRAIASDRGLVDAIVKALAVAVHFFRTEQDAVVVLLQRFLGVERAVAWDLQAFHAPLFRPVPAPSVFFDMAALRDSLKARHPAAARLQAADLLDASFVDALVRSGYIARLYSGAR